MALLCSLSLWANETPVSSIDSVAVDTIANSAPDWYVAPLTRDSLRVGKRALVASAPCSIDSVQIFNEDSVLTGVSVYEYGDTTRTITWTVNPDGSRVGLSKEESGTNGDITFSASYEWDFTANDWKGTAKEEHTFAGSRETLRTLYDWQNGAWSAKTQYTWIYDAAGRETEYTTYARNTAGSLAYSKQRLREYNTAGRMVQEIQYTTYDGTNWTAGNKRVYDYDVNDNKIEDTYYTLYSYGNWIGSTHEVWTYNTDRLKTYYKKESWVSNAWTISNEEFYDYTASGNYLLIEKYALKSGVLAGSSKQVYEYNESELQTSLITYKWSNGEWVNSAWTVTGYDAANNKTETCKYSWKDNMWTGSGNRVLKTYNDKKKVIEQITQTWPSGAMDWVNSARATAEYNAKSQKIQEASYTWKNDQWIGTIRTDWHYNAAGKNDTTIVYEPAGTEWLYNNRTIYAYDAQGNTILSHFAYWDEDEWVLISMTRTDIIYEGSKQVSNASWACEEDSVWYGVEKDSTAYSATGKTTFTAHYNWFNNEWQMSSKSENTYDALDRLTLSERYQGVGENMRGVSRSETEYDEQGHTVMTASYQGWNSATNTWIGYNKIERTYENNQETSLLIYGWGTDDWLPQTRFSYTYDVAGNEIIQMVEKYTDGTWSNSNKYEREYKGGTQVKDNSFMWLNDQWVFISRNETYYDDDAQAKLRREIIGSWNNGVVSDFADNHYFYDCDIPSYTIRFVNYDGSELASYTLKEGKTPSYKGETPSRPADDSNTYTFAGWTPAIAPATADATYTASFTATKRQYTITWLNSDNSPLDQSVVEYGTTPAHADINKESTAQYTFTFLGWSPEPSAVTGDATYTAVFDTTVNTYTITWLNSDNSPLDQSVVEYGTTPAHADINKESTAQYTFTFLGWSPEPSAVTGDATYTAVFDTTVNTYTITWLNSDNSPLDQSVVEYGTTPAHADINKESTAQYTFTFLGWSPEPSAVTGDATYTAVFDTTVNTYTITWLNSDNSPLYQEEVAYGETPVYTGATPTQESTAEFTYTFVGWDSDPAPVTGAAIYKAVYSSNKNSYTVTFYFEDGVTVLASQTLEYGETPSTSLIPSKNDEEHYYYTFIGWSPEITPVTGDASYTPVFTKKPKQYTITFNNYNGRPLWTTTVPYGETPVYNGETPTRPRTQQYSYEFAGWDPELTTVSGDATYTARFTETVNTYTITWLNSDNSPLYQDEVEYGTMPEYQGETPTKDPDAEYRYEFAGWTPRIVAVFTDATYTATYTRHDLHEGIDNVQPPCMEAQKVLRNGTFYILRGDKVYTLDGVLVE